MHVVVVIVGTAGSVARGVHFVIMFLVVRVCLAVLVGREVGIVAVAGVVGIVCVRLFMA